MRAIRAVCFVFAMAVSALAFGQEQAKQTPKMGTKEWSALENTLWDVDQQWLCSTDGKVAGTETRVLRLFVNENGK